MSEDWLGPPQSRNTHSISSSHYWPVHPSSNLCHSCRHHAVPASCPFMLKPLEGSSAYPSKLVVMCLMTFLRVEVYREKWCGYRIFCVKKTEWIEWMRHLSWSLCACSVNCFYKHKTAIFSWFFGASVVPLKYRELWDRVSIFHKITVVCDHRYRPNTAPCTDGHWTVFCPFSKLQHKQVWQWCQDGTRRNRLDCGATAGLVHHINSWCLHTSKRGFKYSQWLTTHTHWHLCC